MLKNLFCKDSERYKISDMTNEIPNKVLRVTVKLIHQHHVHATSGIPTDLKKIPI